MRLRQIIANRIRDQFASLPNIGVNLYDWGIGFYFSGSALSRY